MVSYEPLIVPIGICAFIVLIILLLLSYQLSCHPNTKDIKCFYKFYAILFVIFALGTMLNDMIHITMNQEKNTRLQWNESDWPTISYLRLSADICYFASTLVIYLLFIGRLYYTFNDTYYKLSSRMLMILVIIVIITTLISIFYITCLLLQLFNVYISTKWIYPLFIIYIVHDMVLNATLMVLFVRKLKHVVVAQSENQMATNLLTTYRDEFFLNLDTSQLKFIHVMTKLTVLSGIIIICNEIALTFVMIEFIWLLHKPWPQFVKYSLRTIYLLIAVINVYLNFEINDKIYHRICGSLHIKLYGHFVKDTRRGIKKSIQRFQTL